MRVSKQYFICAAFDTETTNYGVGKDTHAFTILYIFNDLRFVDLRGADLRFADLRDVDLRGANLSGTNLNNADLSYADLSNAIKW